LKKLLLIVWIGISLISSFSSEGYAYDHSIQKVNDVSTDDQKSSQDKSRENFHFQLDKTFLAGFHISFHADLSFEFELPLILDNSNRSKTVIQIEEKEHFKTLFHFIISPNAP